MANNNVSMNECENKILVTNIPKSISRNRLEIHFQKSKFGGGNVVSVVYPKSYEESDCAVVEFEDSSTVQSVLKNSHVIHKSKNQVSVSKFSGEVFQSAASELNKQALSTIDGNYEDYLMELGLNTQTKHGSLIVTGEWYKMKAAFERLEQLHSRKTEDAYQDQSNVDASADVTNMVVVKRNISTNGKEPFSDTISVDADTFELLKRQSTTELEQIYEQHCVTVSEKTKKDTKEITFISQAHDQNSVEKAIYSFQNLYRSTQDSLMQINYDLPKLYGVQKEKIKEAIRRAGAAFPEVVLTAETSNGGLAVFSSSEELCQVAIDVFCAIIGNKAPPKETYTAKESSLNLPSEIPRPLFLFTYPITRLVISVVCGDISKQETDAIVNAANARLLGGGGVTGAIYEAGGSQFRKECKILMDKRNNAPLYIGEVVHTRAYRNLKCREVMHVTGPEWYNFKGGYKDKVRECLRIMKELCSRLLYVASKDVKAKSVAIPAISTGIYDVPLKIFCEAMVCAIETYNSQLRPSASRSTGLKEIRLVNYNRGEAEEIARYFQKWKPNSTPV